MMNSGKNLPMKGLSDQSAFGHGPRSNNDPIRNSSGQTNQVVNYRLPPPIAMGKLHQNPMIQVGDTRSPPQKVIGQLTSVVLRHESTEIANDYMSVSQYSGFWDYVNQHYSVTLANSLKKVKARMTVSNTAYDIQFIIPCETSRYKADIFHLIPMPTFNNDIKYMPKLEAKN